MAKKLLGIYEFGPRRIRIFTDDCDSGGGFDLKPGDGDLPEFWIGLDYREWIDVFDALCHEVYEALMGIMHLRWEPAPGATYSHDRFLFVMTHAQFAELNTCASMGIAHAAPHVFERFQALKAKRKREEKARRRGKKK